MKIDMQYSELNKSTRVFTAALSTLFATGLFGCDGGGMESTGSQETGSTAAVSIYELENLPNRISPDFTKLLSENGALTPSENSNYDTGEGESFNRENLKYEFAGLSLMRINHERNSMFVDLAFDDILNECSEKLLDCTIPADRIRVTITQDVVNRLIQSYTEWAESYASMYLFDDEEGQEVEEGVAEIVEEIKTAFGSMLDKEVALGETHYSQLDGAPYSHSVRTFIERGADQHVDAIFSFWNFENFSVQWNEDDQVAKYTTDTTEASTAEYFYQNKVPGEMVVLSNVFYNAEDGFTYEYYTKALSNDPGQSGMLLETASSSILNRSSSNISGSLTSRVYDVYQTRVDNRGGYSTFRERSFELTDEQSLATIDADRESFDQFGKLLAGERCSFDVIAGSYQRGNCVQNVYEPYGPEGSSVIDSAHYFTPEEFDALVAMQDAIGWKVEGVPIEIKNIAVVSAESQGEISEREVLCRGVQFEPEDAHIFCTATDEQLDNVVVVEHVDGVATRIIPTAKLVQLP